MPLNENPFKDRVTKLTACLTLADSLWVIYPKKYVDLDLLRINSV